MNLPQYQQLEIPHLNRLFDNTSECYKFFWFQAIIKKVLAGKESISYNELIDEMVAEAWYMVTEYHLNLGPRDTLVLSRKLKFPSPAQMQQIKISTFRCYLQ